MAKSILANKESLVKKATYLRIMAADFANSMKAGNFKSLYRGQGIELSGVRDYIRGDDVRTIDWNVTARMGRPYVKVFNEERELQIFLVVDSSASMHLKTGGRTKYEAASEAAAIVTIAAELNNCPIGTVLFDGEIHFSCRPTLSKEQTMTILTRLDKITKAESNGSALGTALSGAEKLLKTRSLVFVFSDFRSANWERPLISLAHRNDVVAIRLQDKYDKELPKLGSAVFQDVESGLKMTLPSSSAKFQKQWQKYNEKNVANWASFCRKHGIIPVSYDAKNEPLQILNSIFNRTLKSKY